MKYKYPKHRNSILTLKDAKFICISYKNGMSINQLRQKTKSHSKTINNILKMNKIQKRALKKHTNVKEILKLYKMGLNLNELASKFNVSNITIKKILNENKVKIRSNAWGLFKGKKSKDNKGYIRIALNPDEKKKYNHGKRNTMPEHRLVMTKHLGRPLERHENVHHINGKRDDNRLENLELWSTSQPSGQKVADKIEWAKQLIRFYKRLGYK